MKAERNISKSLQSGRNIIIVLVFAFILSLSLSNTAYGAVNIIADTDPVNVPEDGTATFKVSLSEKPAGTVTVTVSCSAGDSDISVTGGASLIFKPGTWNKPETVTLSAAEDDADILDGTATISCTSPGLTTKDITANEVDNDFNLTVNNGGNGSTSPTGATVQTKDSAVSISATADTNYHFANWTVTAGSATFGDELLDSTTVTASSDATIQANFLHDTATLTMTVSGSGTITAPLAPVSVVDTATPITITADPGAYTFAGWIASGNALVADSEAASTTVTLSGDATVIANFVSGSVTTVLDNTSVDSLSGANGSMKYFKITVPAGTTLLTATTSGGTGDCDLYARFAGAPTLENYTQRSTEQGTAEEINITNPSAGVWYILLYGYSAADYGPVSLLVKLTSGGPDKPTGLTASTNNTNMISLGWTAVSGATGYEVYRSDVNNVELATKITDVADPTVTCDDVFLLAGNYKYYYWIRAKNVAGTGEFSDSIQGSTKNASASIALVNGTAVTLISDVAGAIKTYSLTVIPGQTLLEIKVSGVTGDCDFDVIDPSSMVIKRSIRGANTELVQIENPASGPWQICLSSKASYSKLSLMAKYSKAIAVPAAPVVSATDGTYEKRVVVRWTKVLTATSYEVYRNTSVNTTTPGADFKMLGTTTDCIYEDNTAVYGMTYYYFAKAKNSYYDSILKANAVGTSKFSSGNLGYVMKAPLPPTTVTASDGIYFDKIRITWAKITGAMAYEVYRAEGSDAGAAKTLIGELASDGTACVFDDFGDDLDITKKYYYFIKAKNANDTTVFSKSNEGSLSKKGPSTISASKNTYFGKIRVAWTAVSGSTSYDVYRYTDPACTLDKAKVGDKVALLYIEDKAADVGGAVADKAYYYKVNAKYNAVYDSNDSIAASGSHSSTVATIPVPALKSVSKGTYDFIRVAWGQVTLAESYNVYRSLTNVFPGYGNEFANVAAPTLSYDDPVADTKTYYFWVTAVVNGIEGKKSATLSGFAAAADAGIADGIEQAGLVGAIGIPSYYSITVLPGTKRLIASLSGTTNALTNDCDLYAKFGCYPTKASYYKKGLESTLGEIISIPNPTAGTWYFMLYGVTAYSGVTLKVDLYSDIDIVVTQVPLNDLAVPFTAVFKGRVIDDSGNGISGIRVQVRNPITGIASWITAKSDAKGYFSYSTLISSEGEHTFDFSFGELPDPVKGTASHTVATRKGCMEPNGFFDFSAYLPATPVAVPLQADVNGLQTFLDIRNGWNEDTDISYATMWVDSTLVKAKDDAQLAAKLDEGLYMFFYGVEGAGVGNDTSPTSALSAVPFVVHVESSTMKTVVVEKLNLLGVIDDTQKDSILISGKIGIVAVVALSEPGEGGTPSNISLLACEQLELLAKLAGNLGTSGVVDVKYSDVPAKQITVELANGRKINVVSSAFVK